MLTTLQHTFNTTPKLGLDWISGYDHLDTLAHKLTMTNVEWRGRKGQNDRGVALAYYPLQNLNG